MLKNRKYVVGVLALLYVASLPFTGFCYRGTNCWPGWGILAFGALGLMDGFQISWLANGLLVVAWSALLMRNKSGDWGALCSGAIAVLIGNVFLIQGVDTSEAGAALQPVSSLGLGYALWMGCLVLTTMAGAYGVLTRRASLSTNAVES